MKRLLPIFIGVALLSLAGFIVARQTYGSTITTILGTDTLSASRSVINTNFSNLNTDKLEATVANTYTALQKLFGGASTTLFSCFGPCYFGATATSTFTAAGFLGIATSSPSQALSVHGNTLISGNITSVANITATGTISAAVGAVGTPSINFPGIVNGATTGLWADGNGQLDFSSTGAEHMSIRNVANAGVQGSGFCIGANFGGSCDVALSRNAAGIFEVNNGTLGSFRDITVRSASTTGQTVLATTAGNVGIGTTTPVSLLSINASGIAGPALSVGSSTSAYLTVLNSGHVIVGGTTDNASANSQFALQNGNMTIANSGASIRLYDAGASTDASIRVNSGALQLYSAGTDIFFSPNNAESVRFQGKNVGVGSTTPWAQLSVNPNALGSGVPEFSIGSSTKTDLLVTNSGNLSIGSTTPFARVAFARGLGVASTTVVVDEYRYGDTGNIATSTSATLDCRTTTQFHWPIGIAATTLTLTGITPNQTCRVIVENPNQTAGAITWAVAAGYTLVWPAGTIPTQTTTANGQDMWVFSGTKSSSTISVMGGANVNFK